jgi:hypothetical protein
VPEIHVENPRLNTNEREGRISPTERNWRERRARGDHPGQNVPNPKRENTTNPIRGTSAGNPPPPSRTERGRTGKTTVGETKSGNVPTRDRKLKAKKPPRKKTAEVERQINNNKTNMDLAVARHLHQEGLVRSPPHLGRLRLESHHVVPPEGP